MWARSTTEIGKIISSARRHHKLTQAELARSLGTTQAWISEVERGKDNARIGLVLRTLSRLGVRLRAGELPWSTGRTAERAAKRRVGNSAVRIDLADVLRRTLPRDRK